MFASIFNSLLISLALTNVVIADYDCLCNYRVEVSMLSAPSTGAPPAGYMYEFDCKAVMAGAKVPSGWYAVLNEHQVMYVEAGNQMEVQTCQGSIPEEDKLLPTTTALPVTTPVITTSTTTTSTATPTTTSTTTPTTTTSTTTPTTTTSTTTPTTTTSTTTPTTTTSTTTPTTTTSTTTPTTTTSTTTPTTTTSTTTPTTTSTTTPTTTTSTTTPTTTTSTTTPTTTSTTTPTTTTSTTTPTTTSTTTPTTTSTTTPTTTSTTTLTTTPKTTTLIMTALASEHHTKQHEQPTTHKPVQYTKDHVTNPTSDWLIHWSLTTDWLIHWTSHTPATVHTTKHHHHAHTTTHAPFHGHVTTHAPQGNLSLCPNHLLQMTNHNNIHQYKNHCYELVRKYRSWVFAENDCMSRVNHRGKLVEITNADTQSFIMRFLRDANYHNALWIGLEDIDREEHFSWDSGARVTYTNWDPNRKGNDAPHGQEDCVLLQPNGLWDDSLCENGFMMNQNNHGWICQYPTHVPHHNNG